MPFDVNAREVAAKFISKSDTELNTVTHDNVLTTTL